MQSIANLRQLLPLLFLLTAQLTRAQITNWIPRAAYLGHSSTAVAYGAGTYLASYDANSILTSTNGSDWIRRQLPVSITPGRVKFANGWFFLLGKPTLYSSDGVGWTPLSVSNVTVQIAFGNNTYVLIASSAPSISVSYNLQNWDPVVSSSLPLSDITFGADTFVAVGQAGVLSSQDAIRWTYAPLTNTMAAIAFGNGYFVALGSGPAFFRSTDGFNWTNQGPTPGVNRISSGLGTFVAVGANTISVSYDGAQWTSSVVSPSRNLYDCAFSTRNCYIVGDDPFLESNPISPPTNPPSSLQISLHAGMAVTGAVGHLYRIEFADDPARTNWTEATTIYLQTSSTPWLDPQPLSQNRFYRAVRLD